MVEGRLTLASVAPPSASLVPPPHENVGRNDLPNTVLRDVLLGGGIDQRVDHLIDPRRLSRSREERRIEPLFELAVGPARDAPHPGLVADVLESPFTDDVRERRVHQYMLQFSGPFRRDAGARLVSRGSAPRQGRRWRLTPIVLT